MNRRTAIRDFLIASADLGFLPACLQKCFWNEWCLHDIHFYTKSLTYLYGLDGQDGQQRDPPD